MARRKSIWERLHESTEGPTVTISIPREWAEELMRSLMSSLEMDDTGEEDPDAAGLMVGGDEDEPGGLPGMDSDDEVPDFSAGDEEDDVPDFAAGDDDEEDADDSDSEEDDEDEEDDDEDETDEAADYAHSGGNPSGLRTGTAFNESAFSRLSRGLARKPVRASAKRRK